MTAHLTGPATSRFARAIEIIPRLELAAKVRRITRFDAIFVLNAGTAAF